MSNYWLLSGFLLILLVVIKHLCMTKTFISSTLFIQLATRTTLGEPLLDCRSHMHQLFTVTHSQPSLRTPPRNKSIQHIQTKCVLIIILLDYQNVSRVNYPSHLMFSSLKIISTSYWFRHRRSLMGGKPTCNSFMPVVSVTHHVNRKCFQLIFQPGVWELNGAPSHDEDERRQRSYEISILICKLKMNKHNSETMELWNQYFDMQVKDK